YFLDPATGSSGMLSPKKPGRLRQRFPFPAKTAILQSRTMYGSAQMLPCGQGSPSAPAQSWRPIRPSQNLFNLIALSEETRRDTSDTEYLKLADTRCYPRS